MRGSRTKRKWIMLSVAMIALLIFFARLGNTAPVESVVVRATAPFAASALYAWNNIATIGVVVGDIKNASKEVTLLRKENQQLEEGSARHTELTRENDALRAQLGVGASRPRILMDAKVIAFDPLSFSYYAVINKGARDGVNPQMPVIMPGDVVFGKIKNVHETTSEVVLIADSGNKMSGITMSGGASGVLGGAKGGSLVLDLIEKSAELSLDEPVVTSGLDGVYPRGLIIGKIAEVISHEEGIFKQARLRPAYMEALPSTVFVIMEQQR
ncbi:MAG: rod shape-determining protein MreC [Candidatus Azambacteria bacterium]|nr:rod shape-determining protein MreC [Candidatus Azambacteria bacterium]